MKFRFGKLATLFVLLLSPQAHALMLSPDIVFTVRDEIPADGIPDSSSVGLFGSFTGFVTNLDFVDETFIEFAVGSSLADSAILNLQMGAFGDPGLRRTFEVSSYDTGTGAVQLGLFGGGSFLQTGLVQGSGTLNMISLNVLALYNDAVLAGDDYLGFRLHDVVDLGAGDAQVFYSTGTSLNLSEVPLPAAIWLFAGALAGLAGLGRRRATA